MKLLFVYGSLKKGLSIWTTTKINELREQYKTREA